MSFWIALKSFFKSLKDPEGAKKYLNVSEKKQDKAFPEHLRLLFLLQKQGRLIDFLKEDISEYNDAQIGAAIRKIHADCGKSLEEYVTLRPICQEEEGAKITIPQGYDVSTIKVVGKVKGQPPYSGVLRHKGWKAHKLSLPQSAGECEHSVVCPAEVEIV